jgi:hypothetical protein
MKNVARSYDDKQLRGWILADEALYNEAREYGGGGDDEMYDKIYDFIDANRQRLTDYINTRLKRT